MTMCILNVVYWRLHGRIKQWQIIIVVSTNWYHIKLYN